MAASTTTWQTRRTRWVIIGAAAGVAALIVVMLGIAVPLLLWPGHGDEGRCRVTAEGLEHREESLRLGMHISPDQRPDADVGDRYTSMDGCARGDDHMV